MVLIKLIGLNSYLITTACLPRPGTITAFGYVTSQADTMTDLNAVIDQFTSLAEANKATLVMIGYDLGGGDYPGNHQALDKILALQNSDDLLFFRGLSRKELSNYARVKAGADKTKSDPEES